METTIKPATAKTQKQFLAAIVGDDLAALRSLVIEHGTEVPLHYQKKTKCDEGSSTFDIRGTALNLAVYFQRQSLATYLTERRAVVERAQVCYENFMGWEEYSVHPVEQAAFFRMPEVTRALMASGERIDWTEALVRNRDDWAGMRSSPTLFQVLLGDPEFTGAIAATGMFRGFVNGHRAFIAAAGPVFNVFVDKTPLPNQATMAEALAAVAERANFQPMTEDGEEPAGDTDADGLDCAAPGTPATSGGERRHSTAGDDDIKF